MSSKTFPRTADTDFSIITLHEPKLRPPLRSGDAGQQLFLFAHEQQIKPGGGIVLEFIDC